MMLAAFYLGLGHFPIKGGIREVLAISRRPLGWKGSGFEQEKMLRKIDNGIPGTVTI